MTVSLDGDIYTFTMDFVLASGETYKAQHIGKIANFGPVVTIDLSTAKYNSNAAPAGNFYVKFENSDYSCEMALDLFADTAATTLPEGTYTYSTENTPNTFGVKSYVDLSNPFLRSNNKLTDGSSVTVTKNDDNYTIAMNLNFEDGRKAVINYNGAISGTPTFE